MPSKLEQEPYRYYRGRAWRRGYTTGAAAAAAARAAVIFYRTGQVPPRVDIPLPDGGRLEVPVKQADWWQGKGRAVVVKDGGDDPDVTHGLEIVAWVEPGPGQEITITGGPGVGQVTRPGLDVPVGEAAINPVPRQMLVRAVREVDPAGGWRVTIAAPGGEKVARRTLNPQLGVIGGISILGTTGVVEPMSEEAFRASLVPQIGVARAEGWRALVMVPGRRNYHQARDIFDFPGTMVVQTGNFMGFMLEEAARQGVTEVLLLGAPGKLVKVAAGSFQTHNRVADGRREVLAALAGAGGAPAARVREILEAPSSSQALLLLQEAGLEGEVLEKVAARASRRATEYVGRFRAETGLPSPDASEGSPPPAADFTVGTVIVDHRDRILAWDTAGREFCRRWARRIPARGPGRLMAPAGAGPRVKVVGVGPGSEAYLLPAARRAVEQAGVIIGAPRLLALFADLPVEKYELRLPLATTMDLIERYSRETVVAVLVSGDPGFHSLLPRLRERYAASEIEVIPGISPLQLAFARLGETWHDARLVSLHGHGWEELEKDIAAPKVAVLTDPEHSPAAVAGFLLARGVERSAWVLERLGYPEERAIHLSLPEMAGREFDPLSLMVLVDG